LRAIIFANGRLNIPETFDIQEALKLADISIAVNGGSRFCLDLGVKPQFLIGDLDSISKEDLALLEGSGTILIRHPKRKDYTDLELALRYAQDQGADEILVLGALGDRWDHTIANILLPTVLSPSSPKSDDNALNSSLHPRSKLSRISFVDGNQEIFFMHGRDRLEISGQPGDTVSLIPLSEWVRKVTTVNLEYPLNNKDLFMGSTLTISNVLVDQRGSVSIQEGSMLCVVIHSISES